MPANIISTVLLESRPLAEDLPLYIGHTTNCIKGMRQSCVSYTDLATLDGTILFD